MDAHTYYRLNREPSRHNVTAARDSLQMQLGSSICSTYGYLTPSKPTVELRKFQESQLTFGKSLLMTMEIVTIFIFTNICLADPSCPECTWFHCILIAC
ncbi:hypothetical protein M413DRAFT_184921 [Hebeloma cylindrosporum]|uniref:Uncharacterized protein n=1 Tax=Hebeloma cylindrosporum TaxID=76867 RepID=A0A0C3C6G5_HEBCY|nr:hypothetical protein M413DRAFT_184921 [Hebeloma cylindrosporum h7]